MNLKHDVKVSCRKCKGTGKVELPAIFVDTLQIVTRLKRACAQEIHAASKDNEFVVASAVNRRLEFLRTYGLVQREREGKLWKYFVNDPDQRPGGDKPKTL